MADFVPPLSRESHVGMVVGDARAALEGGRRLRWGEERTDGPFRVWEGKAGGVPVLIVVAHPGGAEAFYAASRLALRRRPISLLMGVCRWNALEPVDAGRRMVVHRVTDASSLGETLSQAEPTSVRGLPARLAGRAEAGLSGVVGLESEASLGRWAVEQWGVVMPARGGNYGEKAIALKDAVYYADRELESFGAGDWLRQRLGAELADRECLGVAEAAQEESVPWLGVGPAVGVADSFLRAHGEAMGQAAVSAALGRSICEWIEILEQWGESRAR